MYRSVAAIVTSTPVLLWGERAGTHNNPLQLALYNTSTTDTLYLGGSDLSVSNGFPVQPEQYYVLNMIAQEHLYAVSSGADIEVRILGSQNLGL